MDIFTTLCENLIALIVCYREYYHDWPLLPWLHSTEPVEHVFGVLRQLKMDFNFADFLSFAPKLCAFLLGQFGTMDSEARANLTASGYWHTYANANGIDLRALVTWPTDSQISSVSDVAFSEVVRILKAVGIDTEAMLTESSPPSSPAPPDEQAVVPTVDPAPRRTQPSRSCHSLMRLPEDLRQSYLVKDQVDSLSELLRKHADTKHADERLQTELDVTAAAFAAADIQESATMCVPLSPLFTKC